MFPELRKKHFRSYVPVFKNLVISPKMEYTIFVCSALVAHCRGRGMMVKLRKREGHAMQFVRTADLKKGMRLARPIYSKTGVLLFERNSNLTAQAIESIRNFGLLGIYILEPAEPLPPMSEEDLEYERFQTMTVSTLQEELSKLLTVKRQGRMQIIISTLIKKFGHLDGKINFYQNLRSKEDYVYRHSLNVAILCTMICHVMNLRLEDQMLTICAAIVHDMGKLDCNSESVYGDAQSVEEQQRLYNVQLQTGDLLEEAFASDGPVIRRICTQAAKAQFDAMRGEKNNPNVKMVAGAKILMVANRYDELTAMKLSGAVQSEVRAIQELLDNPEVYDPAVVSALIQSIKILFPGVSIEMNTGEKALVLVENKNNILRPVVLSFLDNSIIDLELPANADLHIVDIMKTLDNRYIMDTETLRNAGFQIKESGEDV